MQTHANAQKLLQTWAQLKPQRQLQANHWHTQLFIVLTMTPGAFNSPEFARSSKAYVTATGSTRSLSEVVLGILPHATSPYPNHNVDASGANDGPRSVPL